MKLRPLFNLHNSIADDLCAKADYWLRCNQCGAQTKVNAENFAKYLASGWPRCCNYTMTLENRKAA